MSCGNTRIQVDGQRLIREPLFPLAGRPLLGFRIGDAAGVEKFLEIGEVVAASVALWSVTSLGFAGSFGSACRGRGARAPDPRGVRTSSPRVAALSRSIVCQRAMRCATLLAVLRHLRRRTVPSAATSLQAVAGEDDQRRLASRRENRQRLLDRLRKGLSFVGVGDQIDIAGPIPAMAVISSDAQRRAGP